MYVKKLSKTLYFFTLFTLFFAGTTHAYLDPATTSYVIQAVTGVFIALGAVVGIFWKRIKLFFRDKKMKALEKKLTREAAKKEQAGQ
ncbi:MAG: hypothetical protein Q4E65_04000 [Clostridia bacterium]|nr:hypothetical protein [Clostridia bacterium]